jgi:Fic family protein
MIFDPKYTITSSLASYLLEVVRHNEALDILPITAQLIASLRETSRLKSTHYSTQIEGNALTQKEVNAIANGKKGEFAGRERDELEVNNYFLALEYLENEIQNDTNVSEKLIQKLHGLVLKGSKKISPYREAQNVIRDGSTGRIVYMPPEAKDVKPMMKSLVVWLNDQMKKKEIPAPIIAALIHYQFATIHPYFDGNGRTARLLTTFALHKMGYGMQGIYSLEEYYAKNLQGYYKALTIGNHNYYDGRETSDVTPFVHYFIHGMSVSFRSAREKAQELQSQQMQAPITTKNVRDLNAQQRQILSLFMKQKEVNTADVAHHLGIKSRSAYSLIKKWIDQDFVLVVDASRKARTYGLTTEWEIVVNQS